MTDSFDNRLIDKRVANRYVRKGLVDEKDYEKYMKALPDLADQALPIESAMEGEDDLDDEVEDAPAADPAKPE